MLKIVSMTAEQFGEFMAAVPGKHRWTMEHFPVNHLYFPEFRTVVVVDDECSLVKFPEGETPTMKAAVQVAHGRTRESKE